jgi:photosystem II stability/assembly factor-like uncharacterized protein
MAFAAMASLGAQPRRTTAAPAATAVDTAQYSQLTFRHIGPEGNRVTSVTGVPGDPMTYYAGAASGGVWKSSDGAIHWEPVFDKEQVSSIGALAVATSDHNVVWAGTGEPFIRSHISVGWGVYKSTDAGKNWTKMGLDATGRISRIVVHPTNPDIVYVAALGHAYGPQPERGVFRTMDGGKTWDKVLFVNDSTGISDLVMDPNNPRILFAGSWQLEIKTWGRKSGGAGSAIWTSRDGGTTWKRVSGKGLPEKQVGKIGLAMSKANSDRVYALIETGDGVPSWDFPDREQGRLWRSDDGGEKWTLVSSDRQLMGRTAYYSRMGVMPDNENEAYFLTSSWAKTLDGGKTITDPPERETPGGDHHDIWIDPTNGNRMAVSHDGGFSMTTNRGKSWLQIQLPLAQMYHVTVDDRIPYFVYGNRQDGPSARGPSNSKSGTIIPRGEWRSVGGGESGWATPDPVDSNIVWSSASGFGSVSGIVTKLDLRTGITQYTEIWPEAAIGGSAADAKYRFVWTFPLTISPHDHNTVYVGSQYVHRTTDGGKSWGLISPDLTRNDPSHLRASGGLTPDNIGVEYSGVVFAIAESKLEPGVIWAGTNDGKVQLTRDGGQRWVDLTANLPGLVEWATISNIELSRYDKGTAYLTVDGHQVNNRDPWIYRTTDYGKTWTLIVNGIPKSPLSYVHVVREDPVRRGMLYAGTENGLWLSYDDGARWQPMQTNLPHAPVYWLTVQERFSDLVVATYGRGFWILDDITPLRVLDAESAKTASLFAPRSAYRFQQVEGPFQATYDPTDGRNPKYGASLHYWLKLAPTDSASKDSVMLEILDASGAKVRSLKGPAKVGLNRAWWDLQRDRTKEVKLHVSPLLAPWFSVKAEGTTAPGIQRYSSLVAPGTYTVRLSVGGQTMTQPVQVLKDPASSGSLEDIRAQGALVHTLATHIDSTADMINTVEAVRGQVASLKLSLAGDSATTDIRAAADSLDKKYLALEEELFQVRITGRGQDDVRYPYKLAEKLVYLAQQVGAGDFPPNVQQREVAAALAIRMRTLKAQLDALTSRDLAAFRRILRDRNVPVLIM